VTHDKTDKNTEIDDTPKTFRQRHGKKFLALLGILLMVAFLLPSQISNMVGQGGAGNPLLGRLDGRKVRMEEVRDAALRFQAMRALEVQVTDRMGQPVRYPLAAQIMGEAFFTLAADAAAPWLLLREAYQQSPGTTEASIAEWFGGFGGQMTIGVRLGDGRLVAFENLSQLEATRARQAMRDLLTIKSALDVRTSAIRPSVPMVDWILAQEQQRIRADVVVLDALAFAGGLPAPDEAQLRAHFEKFNAFEPGRPDLRDNPFGFGYRIPDRMKLEVLTLRFADVRARVASSKTPEQWTDEAAAYYVQNEADFRADAPASANPLDVAAPSSGPIKPFEQVRESIIGRLIEMETDARLDQIIRRMRNRTEADRQSLAAARATDPTAAPGTAFGPAFDTFDYLEKLADDVQRQFGVRPALASFANRFLTRIEVAALPDIGGASLIQDDRIIDIPLDLYAFEYSRALASPQQARMMGEAGLELLQLSMPMISRVSRDRFMFRIVAVDPAHPARDIEIVRDRVVQDVLEVAATAAARAHAEPLLKDARENLSLLSTGKPVVQNVEFSVNVTSFPELGITDRAAMTQLINNGSKALLDSTQASGIGLFEVPAARKVLIARRVDVVPTWTASNELDQFRLLAWNELGQQLTQNQMAGNSFFSIESIHQRNNFVPEKPSSGTGETDARP
jgi:hypothetical protein